MCGIIGFTGKCDSAPILLDGLKKLEYRGYDSAGIAVAADGKIAVSKCAGMIENLREKTHDGKDLHGDIGIGHTRWATHGAPNDINAHPHLSNDGKFAIVHNGIIENYTSLREELTAKGFVFHTETDTEAVVHLIDMYYTGDFREAVLKAVARLEGSYAIGVLCADCPDKIIAVRQFSPMILGVGAGENYFASDVTAIVSHTKNVIYMNDGELAELTPAGIHLFDCAGKEITEPVTRIVWDIQAAEKSGYEHFMLKEIMEQPRAVKATIKPRVREGHIVFENLKLDGYLKDIRKIVITACGSASYAGSVGRIVLEELTRIPTEVEFASELRYKNPIIDEGTLAIVISQSGETADTIAALKECKERGAKTLAIVNVVGSTIAKLADDVIYTWAGPEIAVATTKGYTTQVTILYMLAVYIADKMGKIPPEETERLVGEIVKIPQQIQRSIDLNPHIPYLAERYHKETSPYFIGRNMDYAVSLEGSLKLKEISYIHSEAYTAGELKHGPIALVHQDSLVVALACCERLFDKMMSNIKEVKARGARVLAVTHEGNRKIFNEADDAIFIPVTEPLFIAPSEIVTMQLFAYYVAKDNGCNIDKPKNLAKSVTVE